LGGARLPSQFRILLVDDHEVMRRGIRALLSGDTHWEIAGEAENGKEAIAQVEKLHPDLVVLDLTMPVMNGLEAARGIRQIAPATKILIFSMHESPQITREAREAGADAFLSKSALADELPLLVKRLLGADGAHRPQ
jgi:two-component system nitrate/nitrite response regulator NarL